MFLDLEGVLGFSFLDLRGGGLLGLFFFFRFGGVLGVRFLDEEGVLHVGLRSF